MPNLVDILKDFQPKRGITIERTERIKREGSQPYVWNVPALAAGATVTVYVPTQFPDSRKYHPLDSLEIVNNEAANSITVTINGLDGRYIPSGVMKTIHGTGVALWQVAVTNNGAVITTLGQIRLTFQKEAMTIDKWAQRQ